MRRVNLILFLVCFIHIVVAQDRNNEDEVIQLNKQQSQFSSVPGEILVKFVSESQLQLKKTGPARVSSGVSTVDRILGQFDVETVEQLVPEKNPSRAMRKAKAYSGQMIEESSLHQLYRVKLKSDSHQQGIQLIEQLSQLSEVEFAEPNYIVNVLGVPTKVQGMSNKVISNAISYSSEPMYSMQWGLPVVGLDSLWNKPVVKSKRTVIAIIDTGVDVEHPDLKDNLWINPGELNKLDGIDDDGNGFIDDFYGWDFVNKTNRMRDFNAHGTHCAGIAAAAGTNGVGITGANPEALIMSISVMQSNGSGDIATLIKGINYAARNGADIISMSIGTYAHSIALEQALAQAYQTAVLVAAAGNDGIALYDPCKRDKKRAMQLYPGAFTFVLGVQASQPTISETTGSHLVAWSNYDCDGPVYSAFGEEKQFNYELLAPGAGIISTVPGGQYRTFNGTSMATPLVAGGIAALLDRKEFPSQEMLWSTLIQSAPENVDFNAAYSFVPKPALSFVKVETNDTLSGDKDMRPDAGEIMEFYPTIRNSGGRVDSVYFSLRFDEFEDTTTVRILNDSALFGYALTPYAQLKSKQPLRIQINPNVVDGRNIKLVMQAWYGNRENLFEQKLMLNVENGVELKGMLTEDMTLTADKNYIVTDNLAIPEGVTLTIKPGTTLKFKNGIRFASAGKVKAFGTKDSMIVFTKADLSSSWGGLIFSKQDTLKFVKCEFVNSYDFVPGICYDVEITNNFIGVMGFGNMMRSTIHQNQSELSIMSNEVNVYALNIVNNKASGHEGYLFYDGYYQKLPNSNILSNEGSKSYNIKYQLTTPYLYKTDAPNYYGSSKEVIVRRSVFDFETYASGTFGKIDLSNMLKRPMTEAHGIVWKVLVNGFDAQDAFDSIPPLGVGRHKFEVYFNRPMNKNFPPMIAMGVRPPYTQSGIGEEGSWNEAGDVYTAYYTVKAVGTGEGLNRIYVANAKDDENFEIPYENQRFNVIVQAAGSMSTGFEATPGLGKVELKWEEPDGYFDDLLGYNMYRYTLDKNGQSSDTTIVNSILIADTIFTDFDVVPGKTYNYMYKVLRTSMTENEFSKTVSASPLTSIKGDANGSFKVDIADVVATVNYVINQQPKPFIFEAADVNKDSRVDVLDIVGIINIILHPNQVAPGFKVRSTAVYSLENGTLYVESPVALGGVQVLLKAPGRNTELRALEVLNSFERVVQWINDSTCMLLAYSLNGKEIPSGKSALLQLGDNMEISQLVLSDIHGANVIAVSNQVTSLSKTDGNQLLKAYPNPFSSSLIIPLTIGYNHNSTVELVFLDVAGREVDRISSIQSQGGSFQYTWTPNGTLRPGIYFCRLQINDRFVQQEKVIYLP